MAEPWSPDFAALDARARDGLRSLEATRASLSTRTPETKMRFFKARPALAALVTVLALALVSSVAYAVVRQVWISIDPEESAAEIERDVRDQLRRQGVQANVRAEKPGDGKLKISIQAPDSTPLDIDLRTEIRGQPADPSRRAMRLAVGGATRKLRVDAAALDPDHAQQLRGLLTSSAMRALLEREDLGDEELSAAIEEVLVDHGFHDVVVVIDEGGVLVVTIAAPPTARNP